MIVLEVMYYVLLHYKYGQTLGKMFMKVKVVDLNEESGITFRQAVARDIFFIAISIIDIGYLAMWFLSDLVGSEDSLSNFNYYITTLSSCWVILELVSMLTNSKRRAIHDFIAGTVVVKIPEPEIIEPTANSG
jgi:uncharacterized RDD family membrane protein YckC